MNQSIEAKPMEQITDRQRQAQRLHTKIMLSGETAANALVDMAKGLKEMRDSKLYLEMGYETFEEYTAGAVGLKQRQAYTYISTYEKLGDRFLQTNAAMGIAKLEQLAAINPIERVEFLEKNDVEEMSARELKAKVAELNAVKEQLSFLQEEKAQAEESAEDAERTAKELRETIQALEAQIQQEREEAQAAQPSEEQLEKIRAETEAKAREEAEREQEAAITAVKERQEKKAKEALERELARERARLREEYQDTLAAMAQDKEQYKAQLEELEKKQKVSGDNPEVLRFAAYYDQLKTAAKAMVEIVQKLREQEPDTAEKLAGGLQKYLEILQGRLKINGE